MLSLNQIKTRLAWEAQSLRDLIRRAADKPELGPKAEAARKRITSIAKLRALAIDAKKLRRAMPRLKVADRKSARAILDDMKRRARVFRRELEL